MKLTSNQCVAVALIASMVIIGVLMVISFYGDERRDMNVGGDDGRLGGTFELTSSTGKFSLDDVRGNVVVLYFGFTSCPSVCSNSMNVIASSFRRLSEEQQNHVKGLMVTIDPERDTLRKLDQYTYYFHPNILGLSGSKEEIKSVADDYGAFFELEKLKDENDYVFTHSSRYYVIDSKGNLVDAMRHSTTPNELAARIRQLM